jgi:predicted DNA-binding protein (MmcQ/YjbR family)
MTDDEFNRFCGALPATTHVVQWGGSHVWKIGGKVFAIGGWADDAPAFTFKVTALAFEILRHQPGLRPAPYLASRGLSWIQQFAEPGLSDDELRAYLLSSYRLVARGLTKKLRKELALDERM